VCGLLYSMDRESVRERMMGRSGRTVRLSGRASVCVRVLGGDRLREVY
jgi:hypothetical protein